MITQSRLKEVLLYNPTDGVFVWLESRGRVSKGSIAGAKHKEGYIRIRIDGVEYLAHRLAWLYMKGVLPDCLIDHKNGVRDDNRWCNIRVATEQQNMHNASIGKRNSTGIKGLCLDKRIQKWYGQVMKNGKSHTTKYCTDRDEAVRLLTNLRNKLHGEFAKHK